MTLTIHDNIDQGTDEWHDIRRGIVTASAVGKLYTPNPGTKRQEAKAAEREFYYTTCPPGKHHMAPDRTGGGTCMYCGETITADEIN